MRDKKLCDFTRRFFRLQAILGQAENSAIGLKDNIGVFYYVFSDLKEKQNHKYNMTHTSIRFFTREQ